MTKPIYLFGEVLLDCFEGAEPVIGGAPFNVAWHLRAFGEDARLITAVGDDEAGRRITQAMIDWGLSTDYLHVDAQHPTGAVEVSLNEGEPVYDIRKDAAYDFIDVHSYADIDPGALFYHGSLALRNRVSRESCAALRGDYRRRRFIDVNLRSPWWELDKVLDSLEYAVCAKMNIQELQLLSQQPDQPITQESECLALASAFKQTHNIVNLLLTRGELGALLIGANGDLQSTSLAPGSTVVADTVGAGDAFSAVAILGIQHDWDWSTTLERAQQFASFIVTQRGATCTNRKVYQDLHELWHVL